LIKSAKVPIYERYGKISGRAYSGKLVRHERWLRARVVSVKDKSWLKTVAGGVQGDEHKRTTDEVSKQMR
jgi:hypothetical protein